MLLCKAAVPWACFLKKIGQLFRCAKQLDFLASLQIEYEILNFLPSWGCDSGRRGRKLSFQTQLSLLFGSESTQS